MSDRQVMIGRLAHLVATGMNMGRPGRLEFETAAAIYSAVDEPMAKLADERDEAVADRESMRAQLEQTESALRAELAKVGGELENLRLTARLSDASTAGIIKDLTEECRAAKAKVAAMQPTDNAARAYVQAWHGLDRYRDGDNLERLADAQHNSRTALVAAVDAAPVVGSPCGHGRAAVEVSTLGEADRRLRCTVCSHEWTEVDGG